MPIKSIKNVTTFCADITTETCRQVKTLDDISFGMPLACYCFILSLAYKLKGQTFFLNIYNSLLVEICVSVSFGSTDLLQIEVSQNTVVNSILTISASQERTKNMESRLCSE